MASSSSSSRSSSEVPSSPHPRKKIRLSEDPQGSSSDSEDSSSDSDSGSENEDEDTPVLSHAQRRKEKKKAKSVTKSTGVDDADEPKKTVKNSADLPPSKLPKRQNSIWVGNLSFKTTPEAIRNFFEGVGEITRIHMPTKMAAGGPEARGPRKENRGFAYVDFATPDAKTVAITMSEKPLDGRRLLIKDGDDFNGRPAPAPQEGDGADGAPAASKPSGHTKTAQKILSMQKQPPGPTLFLGNLGFETTQDSIRELFESHRPPQQDTPAGEGKDPSDKWIRKIRMGTFEDSGKCKGWAFVDFTTPEHATAALTNPRNHHLNGRKLVVEYASPDAVRRGGGGGPRPEREKAHRPGAGAKRDRPAAAAGADREEGESPAKKRRRDADAEEGGGDAGRGGRPGFHGAGARRDFKADRRRAKPGAALALAKREDVAIVPSEGKKIVF